MESLFYTASGALTLLASDWSQMCVNIVSEVVTQ